MVYGDKRDYKKIDIFVNGKYVATTTWSKNCKEAVKMYCLTYNCSEKYVKAFYQD